MKKILFILFATISFTAKSQVNKKLEGGAVIAKDSFNLDGIFRKTFPGGNTVNGGVVTWVSGLTFAVTGAEYQIKNKVYKSQSGTITLNAAHSSLPRIDVIALDTARQIVKITGTAASTPAIPQINPATQVYLTAVFIGAAATTPGGVSAMQVYDEDVEFSHTSSFPTTNFASTSNPQQGSKTILLTGTGANDVSASGGLKFFSGSNTYAYSNYTVMRFYIRLSAPWTASASLQVGAGNGGEPLTTITAANGFDASLVGVYQNISVPFSQIPKTSNSFSTVYINVTGNGKTFNIDNISLQSGVGGGNGNGYVTNVFRKPGTDSVFQTINGINIYAFKDSTGTGGGGGGITALNGQNGATQTFATGNSGSDFTISSSGNVHTFFIPDASTSARGFMGTSTQSFLGQKTFVNQTTFGTAPTTALNGIGVRNDVNNYTGVTIENAHAGSLSAPTILFLNNGGYNFNSGIIKNGNTKTDYAGPNSFNFINKGKYPVAFGRNNQVDYFIDSTGQLKATENFPLATDLNVTTRRNVDSMVKKILADSGFAVLRPTVNGTQSLFSTPSSTQLIIKDVQNSASVTWTTDANGNLVATAAGGIGGTIAANQIARGTASNTIGGANNFFYDGTHAGINTTTNTNALTVNGSSGGDLLALESTDNFVDIIGNSATATFTNGDRFRFGSGQWKIILGAVDKLVVKSTGIQVPGYTAGIVHSDASGNFSVKVEVWGEEKTGSTASTYTIANAPATGTLRVFKNGIRLPAAEYSVSGTTVTLTSARLTTDVFINDYKY